MVKTAYILLAPGFEEIEALSPLDLLRRAGLAVQTLGLDSLEVEGSHQLTVMADLRMGQEKGLADVLIIPGGPGSQAIAQNPQAMDLIKAHHQAGKLVAAICAAPAAVLAPLGLLEGHRFTCFPGWETGLDQGEFAGGSCVVDGQLITARGVGAAAEFGLEIIKHLLGPEKAREIHHQTVQRIWT